MSTIFVSHQLIQENNYFNIRQFKYCAFIIVNFILYAYFNKCAKRLRADSLSLNCILFLVVREKTCANTAYFYPLRKAEVSISTYHDYSSGKEAD